MIDYQEGEEDGSRLTAQVRLTGKAMRMRAQGKGMVVSDEEEKFDEEIGHTDVKLEPDGNLVLDGVSKGESFKNVYHFFFRRCWQESES